MFIVLFHQVFYRIEIFQSKKTKKRKNISCTTINRKTCVCIKAIKCGNEGRG